MTHKHANFLKAIAEGPADEIDMWESRRSSRSGVYESWGTATRHLNSIVADKEGVMEMRRKPDMVVLNGIECPAPLRRAPELGTIVWFEDAMYGYDRPVGTRTWDGSRQMIRALQLGVLHATEDGAVSSVRARYPFIKEVER